MRWEPSRTWTRCTSHNCIEYDLVVLIWQVVTKLSEKVAKCYAGDLITKPKADEKEKKTEEKK